MCVSGDGSDELTLRENGGVEKWSFTSPCQQRIWMRYNKVGVRFKLDVTSM